MGYCVNYCQQQELMHFCVFSSVWHGVNFLTAFHSIYRFLKCFQTLVGCGLSGPTSPLAFGEAVLGALSHSTGALQNKEQLWMMWNAVVSPLTERITEVGRQTGVTLWDWWPMLSLTKNKNESKGMITTDDQVWYSVTSSCNGSEWLIYNFSNNWCLSSEKMLVAMTEGIWNCIFQWTPWNTLPFF